MQTTEMRHGLDSCGGIIGDRKNEEESSFSEEKEAKRLLRLRWHGDGERNFMRLGWRRGLLGLLIACCAAQARADDTRMFGVLLQHFSSVCLTAFPDENALSAAMAALQLQPVDMSAKPRAGNRPIEAWHGWAAMPPSPPHEYGIILVGKPPAQCQVFTRMSPVDDAASAYEAAIRQAYARRSMGQLLDATAQAASQMEPQHPLKMLTWMQGQTVLDLFTLYAVKLPDGRLQYVMGHTMKPR